MSIEYEALYTHGVCTVFFENEQNCVSCGATDRYSAISLFKPSITSKPRTSQILGKPFTTKVHPQAPFTLLKQLLPSGIK